MTEWTLPPDSPRAGADRIAQFIGAYASTEFHHARAVIALLRLDDHVSRISAHAMHLDEPLRAIYGVRATITARAPASPYYPTTLADDVRALASALDAANDQPLCLWRISLPTGVSSSCSTIAASLAACIPPISAS